MRRTPRDTSKSRRFAKARFITGLFFSPSLLSARTSATRQRDNERYHARNSIENQIRDSPSATQDFPPLSLPLTACVIHYKRSPRASLPYLASFGCQDSAGHRIREATTTTTPPAARQRSRRRRTHRLNDHPRPRYSSRYLHSRSWMSALGVTRARVT